MNCRGNILRLWAEMLSLFAALAWIDHGLLAGDAFASVNPNPYWLPVLIMALAYGTSAALAAAGIASGIWVMAPHTERTAGDHLQLLMQISVMPMLWFIAAVSVGEVTLFRKSLLNRQKRRLKELEWQRSRVAETLSSLARTNRMLQVRIAAEERTIGDAVFQAIGMFQADPAAQISTLERLVALAAKTEDFTFFSAQGSKLLARFRGTAARQRSFDLSDVVLSSSRQLEQQSFEKKMFAGSAVAGLPVRDKRNGQLVGLLLLHSRPATTPLTEADLAELSRIADCLAQVPAVPSNLPVSKKAVWAISKGEVA